MARARFPGSELPAPLSALPLGSSSPPRPPSSPLLGGLLLPACWPACPSPALVFVLSWPVIRGTFCQDLQTEFPFSSLEPIYRIRTSFILVHHKTLELASANDAHIQWTLGNRKNVLKQRLIQARYTVLSNWNWAN